MKNLIYLAFIFIIISCQSKIDNTDNLFLLNGFIQKGPFIQGSEVRVQELTNKLLPNGKSYYTETNNDFGSFKLEAELGEGYIDIATTGFYYNEVEGELSNSYITLKCLSYLKSSNLVNVNVLTTLSYNRIKFLILNKNYSFESAREEAQKEVLNAFNISLKDTTNIKFEELDISQNGANNSILLAISSILQYNNSEAQLSEFIIKIAGDIEEDGLINNDELKLKIRNNSKLLEPNKIRQNLIKRFNELGINVEIPEFNDFIDSDGDGVININESSKPYFKLQPGVYSCDTIIEVLCEKDAIIFYTIDGSVPDSNSNVYLNPIQLKGDGNHIIIKAVSKKELLDFSETISGEYLIEYPPLAVYFSVPSGLYYQDQYIALSCNIPETKIYYTIDGSFPDENSIPYESPIELHGDENTFLLKAIAIKNGYRSVINQASYSIKYSNPIACVFSRLAGTYNNDLKLELSTPTEDATIFYTMDGSTPTTESFVYNEPIDIKGNGTNIFIATLVKSKESKFSNISYAYYKIDYSYNQTEFFPFTTLDEIRAAMVGKWVGNADSPWQGAINVEFTFNELGRYTSRALSMEHKYHTYTPALYRGTDSDSEFKIFKIDDISYSGNVTGRLQIYFADSGTTNVDNIKFLKFSKDQSVMTFELWRGNYGPIKYNLTRIN